MKKKTLLIASLGLVMSLASCVNYTDTDVDQTLPTDDPSSQVTILFWHCLGHEKTSNFAKIVDSFNEKYKGKYQVELQHIAGEYNSLDDAIKTLSSSGSVPAIAMGYPDSFSGYMTNRIEKSQLLRLDNFINDPTYGFSKEELDDFIPGYYSEGTSYQHSGTWSLPMYKSTEVMYYNYDYFYGNNALNDIKFKGNARYEALVADDKNIDYDALKEFCEANGGYTYTVPTRWNEMFELAAQMKRDREAVGLSGDENEFYPVGYDSDANMMISQMAQRDIPYTINDASCKENARNHFVFDNAQTRSLLEEITGYLENKLLITKNALGGTIYTNTYFNDGKIAMTIGSTGGSSYNISENFKVDIAPVPYSNKQLYIQQGPSICFFDNEDPYIHKGAWLFYKEMSTTLNNTTVALANSYDPVRKSCYETDDYKNFVANAEYGLKWKIPALTKTLTPYYMTSPVFVGSSAARNEIGDLIQYIYVEHKTMDKAFETALNKCYSAALELK